MKRIFLYILILLPIIISCSEEDNSNTGRSLPGQANVIFQLTENDENNINTIDVLAFKVDENDNTKEYFAYRTKGKDIQENGGINKKKISVSLIKGGSTKYRFVVLANASDQVDALGDISPETLKKDLLEKLTFSHADKWITNNTDPNYINIPMWAESAQIEVNDNTQTITGIHLVRMLARLDILIDIPDLNKFKLKSIRVYNYNTNGRIVPDQDPIHWDGTKVLKATIPTPAGKVLGPLVYTGLTTPDIAITKGIYLFEAAAVGAIEETKATCLVIGGEYNNEGKETFYRMDFANTDGNGKITYLDILRNNLYNVKITQVSGTGYDTPDDAFGSKPINLKSDITVWDQGGLSDIVYDGHYLLGVSQKQFSLPLDQRTTSDSDNKLTITTDYPSGWTIEKIVDSNLRSVSWLTVNRYVGSANTKTTISLLADANITGVNRTAYIYIKAGRLQYIIEVLQTVIPDIRLNFTNADGELINDLIFYSYVGTTVPQQTLNVTWVPKSANPFVSVTSVAGASNFDFGTGDRIDAGNITGADGLKAYSIQPPPMTQTEIDANPFLEKAYKIDYTVSNSVTYESKVLYLTQKNYAAIPNIDANFVMDGTEQYFTINANAPWEIEIVNDPLNIIQDLTTTTGGQYADKRDEKVYFRTRNHTSNASITEGEVTFRINMTNIKYPFSSKNFTIKCYNGEILPASNTYLVPRAAVLPKSYLIPVSRANLAIPGSIGSTDKLEAHLVWTDDLNHVTSMVIEAAGRGNTGYIYFYPGDPQGNTVIAARVGGVIKWSWHIWTANFDPIATIKTLGGFQLMDRNIGALNEAPGNYYSVGTFYQWGRKDPFPPAAGNATNVNEKIYNKSGQIASIPTSTSSAGVSYSIQNPLTYLITGTSWNGSAAGSSWNDGGSKSIYDPCPPGWKVPPSSLWANFNTGNFIWNGTNRGRQHATAGWFPASGIRSKDNSNLGNVGAIGGYGSSTFGTPYVPTLDIKSTSVTYNLNYFYIDGVSIRCMKE